VPGRMLVPPLMASLSYAAAETTACPPHLSSPFPVWPPAIVMDTDKTGHSATAQRQHQSPRRCEPGRLGAQMYADATPNAPVWPY